VSAAKTCVTCGKPFEKPRGNKITCTREEDPTCRRTFDRRRKADERKKKTVLLPRKGDLWDPVAQRWIPAVASESLPDDLHVQQRDGDLNAGLHRDDPAALWLDGVTATRRSVDPWLNGALDDAHLLWTARAVTRRAIAYARAEDQQGIPMWIVWTLANIAEAERSAQLPARDDRPSELDLVAEAQASDRAEVTSLEEYRAARQRPVEEVA
jgi:hypothetical protein